MTLYTAKAVAQWIDLTERRVRQLRDEGIIEEVKPGLYDLQPTVLRYIRYARGAGKETLTDERTRLTKAKREAAEMENELRRGELCKAEDTERGLKTVFLNIRSRFLSLPAKLSPELASMSGNQKEIFDALKSAIDEILTELSNFRAALAVQDGEEYGEEETET